MKWGRVLLIAAGAGAIFVGLHGFHGWSTNGNCVFCKYMKGE